MWQFFKLKQTPNFSARVCLSCCGSMVGSVKMRISHLFITFLSVLVGSLAIRSLVFPSETSTSYVEMIPQKPLSLKAFTLCMRVATELSGEREIILFAYRTPDFDELNVWRELDGRLTCASPGIPARVQQPSS
ncbi:pentraxin fusion protein-like isoform 3-T3 [Anableps anableps]